jgi:CDP-diacylglycerol---glycerol-3-phosphate 3-phosphatidyltransferase
MPESETLSRGASLHIDDSDRQCLKESQNYLGRPATGAQKVTDGWVKTVLLWMFPYSWRPNHFTIVRFILTPVVLVLLYYHLNAWAFGVFAIAVSTDFIDGAMARTRDQITAVGMVIDPIADKLLVGSTLAWVGYQYLVVQIILGFIALELILLGVGLGLARPGNRARPANVFGKTKMVIQSIALTLFLVSGIFGFERPKTVSLYLLWAAIALAILSGAKHLLDRFQNEGLQTHKTA